MKKLYSGKRKMRPKPIFVLVVVVLICWLSVGSQPAQGEAGVDLLLLVDASDSMRVLDRDRLADQIARSVLRYLVEDFPGDTTSRVGIICFSDRMTPLLTLTPLREVDLEQVSVECERGGGTLFVKTLEEVPSVFRAEPRPENRKVILLITDGHPSYRGESVVEDEVNRNYLLGYVAPKISELQDLDEKPTLYVIGVGETKFIDFWSQYNFTRVEDSDHLLRIGALLAELFPVAPPPSPTLTPAFTPSPSPSPTFTLVPPTSTPSPSPVPTSTPAPTSTPSPSATWTPSPSPTPSPTSPLLATPTTVEQVTPTPTPTVKPPRGGLVPPRAKPFLWLIPLGLLGGLVLWNLVRRLKGEDIRKIGDLLLREENFHKCRELCQKANLRVIGIETELREAEPKFLKATDRVWKKDGPEGVFDLWSIGEQDIARLFQRLLAQFIIAKHEESEALSTILNCVNAGKFRDKGEEFPSRFFEALSGIFEHTSEKARDERRQFSPLIYREYAKLLWDVAYGNAKGILTTLLNIPDVLDMYDQDKPLSLREDVYYLCYFLAVLDRERLSDGRKIRFYTEAEEGLRQGFRYKDLPDLLAPLKGLQVTTPAARATLQDVQNSILQSSTPQFEKAMIMILLRELEKVSVESASETNA